MVIPGRLNPAGEEKSETGKRNQPVQGELMSRLLLWQLGPSSTGDFRTSLRKLLRVALSPRVKKLEYLYSNSHLALTEDAWERRGQHFWTKPALPVIGNPQVMLEVEAASIYETESAKRIWAFAVSISNLTLLESMKYVEMYTSWFECHDQFFLLTEARISL